MAKIRAVVKQPDRNPVIMLIDASIETISRIVEGSVEFIAPADDLAVFVNAHAVEQGMKKNCKFMGKQIVGPAVFAARRNGVFESLDEDRAEQIRQQIKPKK